MKYRAEIDGLRTIAIISVLIYHAEFLLSGRNILPGGFFGVDVFFVISGYLVPTIILNELEKNGKFSFANFYERRARRLLPALILVIVFFIPLAYFYLLPEQLTDFSSSIISSLGFVSNFYWNSTLQGYEVEDALLKPFLHTWSLAVEEQYYIIIPILLLFIHNITTANRKQQTANSKQQNSAYVLILLSAIFIASLIYAHFTTKYNQSLSFYMLPSRLWEMLAGTFLAYFNVRQINISKYTNEYVRSALPWAGLLMIFYSFFFFDFSFHHPGFITLLPVLGTVLIIQFCNGTDFLSRILSLKVIVGIGLISYSLYLWHYPVFAFGRLMLHTEIVDKFLWIVITFILAIAGYFCIEKPFRNRNAINIKVFLVTLFISIATIVFVLVIFIYNSGFSERFGYMQDALKQSNRQWLSQNGQKCHSGGGGRTPAFPLSESCSFINNENAKTVVLIGDSHAATFENHIKKLADNLNLNYIQFTNAGCNHIVGLQGGLCESRSQEILIELKKLNNPIVIYSSRIPLRIEQEPFDNKEGDREANFRPRPAEYLANQPIIIDKIQSGLNHIAKLSTALVLIYPVPEQGFHVRDKLAPISNRLKNPESFPVITTRYDVFRSRTAKSYEALDDLDADNIIRVYPEKIFCDSLSNACMVAEKTNIYFASDNHLSPLGAEKVVSSFAKQIERLSLIEK